MRLILLKTQFFQQKYIVFLDLLCMKDHIVCM